MSKFTKSFGLPGLTVALAVLVWCAAGFAQLNTSKIEGTVRDKDTGQPLQGAQVIVEGTRLGNVTNADGYYFILNVPPGRRSVTFTFTGYQKTTISDQMILAGQTVTINGELSSTIVELGGITVEGESEVLLPRDQTVSKQRLTAEAIAETPATKLEDMTFSGFANWMPNLSTKPRRSHNSIGVQKWSGCQSQPVLQPH